MKVKADNIFEKKPSRSISRTVFNVASVASILLLAGIAVDSAIYKFEWRGRGARSDLKKNSTQQSKVDAFVDASQTVYKNAEPVITGFSKKDSTQDPTTQTLTGIFIGTKLGAVYDQLAEVAENTPDHYLTAKAADSFRVVDDARFISSVQKYPEIPITETAYKDARSNASYFMYQFSKRVTGKTAREAFAITNEVINEIGKTEGVNNAKLYGQHFANWMENKDKTTNLRAGIIHEDGARQHMYRGQIDNSTGNIKLQQGYHR